MGDGENASPWLQFNPKVRLEFHGSNITSDAGLLAFREFDDALGLTDIAEDYLQESCTGRNIRHHRGTAEQWIKEGKYTLNWTRLSCHKFVANHVRLELFILAYNLGNFLRRLVLPEPMKHWPLTSLQTRVIKTGGRLVRHARKLVFQLAEVLVTREMLGGILERIGRLKLAPD